MVFNSYKNRTLSIGQEVEVYRNLHVANCFSIRCAKTKLVLAHCSTITLTNAKFIVSKRGNEKVKQEKRKNVHAVIRGIVETINQNCPKDYSIVKYNPYFMEQFMINNTPLYKAEKAHLEGKYAYALI